MIAEFVVCEQQSLTILSNRKSKQVVILDVMIWNVEDLSYRRESVEPRAFPARWKDSNQTGARPMELVEKLKDDLQPSIFCFEGLSVAIVAHTDVGSVGDDGTFVEVIGGNERSGYSATSLCPGGRRWSRAHDRPEWRLNQLADRESTNS